MKYVKGTLDLRVIFLVVVVVVVGVIGVVVVVVYLHERVK